MKHYMVIGASSGIGREVARQISNEETAIILVARRRDRLEQVQTELKGTGIVIPCDVTKTEEIEKVFSVLRDKGIKLDGLVYCAGIYFLKTVKVMTKEDLEYMFQVNLFGFYEMCRNFQKVKISNQGAAIVGISSYAAMTNEIGLSAYTMTKEAMNVQVRVMAKEFLKRKIRINTIMPANVISKMSTDYDGWTKEEIEAVRQKQPLGIIPVGDVVKLVKFLLSEDARYITGETIAISAGYHV